MLLHYALALVTDALVADFACTVTYHYVDDDRLFAILFLELSLCCLAEVLVKVILYKVDGAAAKAAAHDTATCNHALLGNIVEEVELFARHFVVLRQALVSLVHLLTNGLVVTLLKCFAEIGRAHV